MQNSGSLEAIWIKRMKRGPMDAVATADLVLAQGLANNANQRGRRQITLLEQEVWVALMQLFQVDLQPSARRANLLTRGIRLARSRGKILQVGNCQIEILGETKPCERMDELIPGLKQAMYPDWKGGAFGRVLQPGQIKVGDAMVWL